MYAMTAHPFQRYVTQPGCIRDMTHPCVWHDSFRCVPWLHIYVCGMWLDSCTYVTWCIHVCDMTHSYVWLITMCLTAHPIAQYVTWPMCICDMTHSCVWYDSFIRVTRRVTWQVESNSRVTSYIAIYKSCQIVESRHISPYISRVN